MSLRRRQSNKTLHPQNSRVAKLAADVLNNVAAVQQEKYHNAFIVNGFPCLVYSSLRQGLRCTCGGGHVEFNPVTNITFDDNGNATEETLNNLLFDEKTEGNSGSLFSIDEYSTEPSTSTENGGYTINLTPNVSDTPEDISSNEYSPESSFIDPELLGDDDEIDQGSHIVNNIVGVTNVSCGICYGSGFVSGYSLLLGNRLVFDAQHKQLATNGYAIDSKTKPFTFRKGGENLDASVDFIISLPKFIEGIDALRVWENTRQVFNVEILAGATVNNLVTVTENNLAIFCTGAPVYVRVKGPISFTHIEIQINLSKDVTYLEYPRFTKTGDTNVLDAVGDVNIVLSPKVLNVDVNDMVVDLINQRIWRITSITDFKDRNINIQGSIVNARLVQRYEKFSILPHRVNKQNQKNTTRFNQNLVKR